MRPSSDDSLKAFAPMMPESRRMHAASPTFMVKVTLTRLRSTAG
jgi:hypothetical protein